MAPRDDEVVVKMAASGVPSTFSGSLKPYMTAPLTMHPPFALRPSTPSVLAKVYYDEPHARVNSESPASAELCEQAPQLRRLLQGLL